MESKECEIATIIQYYIILIWKSLECLLNTKRGFKLSFMALLFQTQLKNPAKIIEINLLPFRHKR